MKVSEPLGLEVVFHADWWKYYYDFDFGPDFYFVPDTRVDAERRMNRILSERFQGLDISYDKDQVGPVIHVYAKPKRHRVCTFHSGDVELGKGDLDYYTFKEINDYKKSAKLWLNGNSNGWNPDDKNNPFLHKCYGTSFGSLLIKRRVLEEVPFRTHPTFIHGEDLWYYKEAFDKGFESWVDTSYRVPHRNVDWKGVNKVDFNQYIGLRIMRIGGNNGSNK